MQTIKEHIKNKKFKNYYLLYGSEEFLKNLYKNKLKNAIVGNEETVNYSYFEGKSIDLSEVISIAETMPFFSECRLIIIENSGLFSRKNEFADSLKRFPKSTVIIFLEQEIDKRNRLYKAVKVTGIVSEMNGLDEKNMQLWIVSTLQKSGKKITKDTVRYFFEKTGTSMTLMQQELEKLVCYVMDKEIITTEDIDAVCTVQIVNQIFSMIDAIAYKKLNNALGMYYDLISLREQPLGILFLITRHFNILLKVKDLVGTSRGDIAKKVGIPPFTVMKYQNQSRNFSKKFLIHNLELCAETEEKVKTGRIDDKLAIEILIISLGQSE